MIRKVVNSKDVSSHSFAMKHLRLISVAMILLICGLVFVGAAGADEGEEFVAEIVGGGQYTSIQYAIGNATDGDTIKVIKDHYLDSNKEIIVSDGSKNREVLIHVNKNITIDLNGFRVTADYRNTNNDIYSVIAVANGKKLTMIDNSEGKTGVLHVNTTEANIDTNTRKVRYLLFNINKDNHKGRENCSLIINGGTYLFDYADHKGESAIVYSLNSNTTLITGGNFWMGNTGTGDSNSNGSPWVFNGAYNDANQIVVTGGTFNEDLNHRKWEFEVGVPRDYALRKNEDDTWTVVPAVAYVTEYHIKYNSQTNQDNLPYTRDVGYATIEEAISYIDNHDSRNKNLQHYSITLIEDAELENTLTFSSLAKPTFLNMNDKKIIWKGDEGDDILTVSGNSLTINSFSIECEGHEIKKWKIDATEQEKLPENGATSVEVRQSLSVANSELNTYTITFDTNGGSTVDAITQNYGTEITAPADPTNTGYTFSSWNPDIPATMPAENMIVKALWVANTYTVTFDAGEGTVDETTRIVTFDKPYGELPTPTREGYEFDGWYLNDNQITVETPVNVDEDHTLTAVWKKIEKPAGGEIRPSSSSGSSSGNYYTYPRTTTNGGLVDFGSSKVIKALMLPEGSSGSVILKVDSIKHYPEELETEYTFDISVEKLGEGMAYIHFEIPLSTLENLGLTPADICAYHLVDDVWVKLTTTYEVKDGTVFYEAETDSFSPFKLVIEEGAATPKAEETEPTVPPTEEPEDKPQEELPPIDPPVNPTEPESPAPILAVLAGLGAAAILRRK